MTGTTLNSVKNALQTLRALSSEDSGLGVTELARRLGLAKSTVHRTLATLAGDGFVRQLDDGRYTLGYALWELGSRMVGQLQLREVAHPVLEELRNKTNETVHLSILDGTDVLYIDRFESEATLTLFRRLGFRMPAHATSSGKAILAFSGEAVVERVLNTGLARVAPGTITKKRDFVEALEQIRELGYVVSIDESEEGVASVGAPVFDFEDKVAGAVSVAGPSQRLPMAVIEKVKRMVRKAANDISRGLGNPRVIRVVHDQ